MTGGDKRQHIISPSVDAVKRKNRLMKRVNSAGLQLWKEPDTAMKPLTAGTF